MFVLMYGIEISKSTLKNALPPDFAMLSVKYYKAKNSIAKKDLKFGKQ